jgi:hypothetical protein
MRFLSAEKNYMHTAVHFIRITKLAFKELIFNTARWANKKNNIHAT